MVQEARLKVAMTDLNKAQAQLDEKQKELDAVQALYDAAVGEKQVPLSIPLYSLSHKRTMYTTCNDILDRASSTWGLLFILCWLLQF